MLILLAAAHAQSFLPATIPAEAQGVYAPVPVVLERVVSTREPALTPWEQQVRQQLARFGRQQSPLGLLPPGLQPEAALYRVQGVDAHWVFDPRTDGLLLPYLDSVLEVSPWGCVPFQAPLFRASDLLTFSLEGRRALAMAAAADGLSDLLVSLGTADAGTWQPVYERACDLDDEGFNRLNTFVFFVDPTPFSGPDTESWLVVLRTGYSE